MSSTLQKLEAHHWIGGEWVRTANQFPSFNPANGALLGHVSDGGVTEAKEAIAVARRVFEEGTWAASPRLRAAVLLEMAQAIEADAVGLADLLCAENGKVRRECAGEAEGAASELRYYAGLTRSMAGRLVETAPGIQSHIVHEAAGVVGIIVPWNAPLILLVRSLAPALAAGCTIVIKAAPQTALFMGRVMEQIAKVKSLPAGVINLVFETGHSASEEIVASVEVDVVSYTGSTAVGKRIMAAAAPTLKRLSLELGGKAACVVCEDADLSKTVPDILAAGTILSGQQCTAASRILVHQSRFAQFRDLMTQAMKAMKIGPGHLPDSQMGSLIDTANRDRALQLIERFAQEHTMLVRGERVAGLDPHGAFISPSLVEVHDTSADVVQNEHFAPIMTLETFETDRQAVTMANATRFGLGSSVWSSDLARAQRIAKSIRCGTVWVNAHNKLFAEVETGGYRESGFGRLHGLEGLVDFMQTKHIYQDIGQL